MAVVLNSITFSANGQNLDLPTPEAPAEYVIQVIGAGVMTIEFADSLDGGTTYNTVQVYNQGTNAYAANITAAGLFRVTGPGGAGGVFRRPRIRTIAFTSGTLTVQVASVVRN